MSRHPRHAATRASRLRAVPARAGAAWRRPVVLLRRLGTWRRRLPTPRGLGRALGSAPGAALSAVARARRRRPLSVEHRRARAMLVAAVAFAGIVLLTSFPLSELLAQRSALSSTAQKVSSFEAADQALSAQLAALDQTGAMGDLARRDYGFVADGQRAYDILPPPGGSAPTSLKSGYVPLEGPPVAPGSARSEALTGLPPSAPVHGVRTASVVAPGSGAGGGPPPGYWGRVLHSLEFWN